MKKVLYAVMLLLGMSIAVSGIAQNKDVDETVYAIVEEMPEFPGGQDQLNVYLSQNLRYPQSAHDNGIQGRAYVSFVVEKDGSVSDVKMMRSLEKF